MLLESDVEVGNSLDVLKTIPDETFDTCVTSPPYYMLRKYETVGVDWPDGWKGELGLEPTPTLYIQHLVSIFDEVKRTLKPGGSAWVVIGDTYGTKSGGMEQLVRYGPENCPQYGQLGYGYKGVKQNKPKKKGKSLLLIPQRFAIAMADAGWTVRSDIIWRKPNCMPSSAKDRFTVDYEHIFFFVKNNRPLFYIDEKNGIVTYKKQKGFKSRSYFFDTQYEPYKSDGEMPKVGGTIKRKGHGYAPCIWDKERSVYGRIKRCVWDITTKAYHGMHYAVFPPQIVELILGASCPKYICGRCGLPYFTLYDEVRIPTRPGKGHKTRKQEDNPYKVCDEFQLKKPIMLRYKSGGDTDPNDSFHNADISRFREQIVRRLKNVGGPEYNGNSLKDYTEHGAQVPGTTKSSILESMSKVKFNGGYAKCDCNTGFYSGVVLDPFAGSGTTLMVAKEMGRDYFGIEVSDDYVAQVRKRLQLVGANNKPIKKRKVKQALSVPITLLQFV